MSSCGIKVSKEAGVLMGTDAALEFYEKPLSDRKFSRLGLILVLLSVLNHIVGDYFQLQINPHLVPLWVFLAAGRRVWD